MNQTAPLPQTTAGSLHKTGLYIPSKVNDIYTQNRKRFYLQNQADASEEFKCLDLVKQDNEQPPVVPSKVIPPDTYY